MKKETKKHERKSVTFLFLQVFPIDSILLAATNVLQIGGDRLLHLVDC